MRRDPRPRSRQIERAIANVLCGASEDDEFNQLVLYAGLDTQAVVWLRAWFRYLRQTGKQLRPGDHRRCAAPRARMRRARSSACSSPRTIRPCGSREQRSEDFAATLDRFPRQGPLDRRRPHPAAFARAGRSDRSHQCLRSRRRGSARIQDQLLAWFRGFRRPFRGAKSGSTARASRLFTCAAARSPAAASAGRTGATISAPRSSA